MPQKEKLNKVEVSESKPETKKRALTLKKDFVASVALLSKRLPLISQRITQYLILVKK